MNQAQTSGIDLFTELKNCEALCLQHQAQQTGDSPNLWDGLGFSLHGLNLCVDIALVDEIVPPPSLTPVPGAAAWLQGLTHIRGNLITVIDLKLFLFSERTEIGDKTQVLVINHENQHLGLLVDAILGQQRFDKSQAAEQDEHDWTPIGAYIIDTFTRNEQVWGIFDLMHLLHNQQFLDGAARAA